MSEMNILVQTQHNCTIFWVPVISLGTLCLVLCLAAI